ncbi:MAG: hypothetical protein K6G56_03765 [Clostridiales bacterium]|nr:hypothetical protein [Clostridiales bacterium]
MAKSKNKANPLGAARRSIWFVLRAVLVISLLLGLAYAVFTEFMYISNMYIITTEGMKLRADTVLKNGDPKELEQYYTETFLATDVLINSKPYQDYAVDSFDYRYNIKGFSVLPWSKVGTVTYIERIPLIVASPISDNVDKAAPAWTSMTYKIRLVKNEGKWLIAGLEVIEENPAEEARPTPDYSQLEGNS